MQVSQFLPLVKRTDFFRWTVSLLLLVSVSPCPAQAKTPSLAVMKDSTGLYLLSGKSRLLLRDQYRWPTVAGPSTVPLPGNATVSLDRKSPSVLDIKCGAQTTHIVLNAIAADWFTKDDNWGGHETANWLRGVRDHEGVTASLMNMIPVGKTVLGVITWHSVRGSGNAIKAQQLVRIRLEPQPAVEPLRPLDLPAEEWIYGSSDYPCQRLLKVGAHLLLYRLAGDPGPKGSDGSGALEEIDANGKILRIYARLPHGHYPVGVLQDRWLLDYAYEDKPAHALWIYDFKTKREKPLPGNWNGVAYANYIAAPPQGNRLLIMKPEQSPKSHSYLVSLPTGRRIAIPNPSGTIEQFLWKGMAVLVDSPQNQISVYSATSGHLLRRLPLPK